MASSTFEADLKVGQQGEEIVRQILVGAGCETYVRNRGRSRDLMTHVMGNWFWVEVKTEVGYDENSRNICIETRQGVTPECVHGRWSGINVSEAQVFIHLLGNKAAVYRKEPMRFWLRGAQQGGMTTRAFGDNGNRGFIVPIVSLMMCDFFTWCDLCAIPSAKVWRV